MKIIDEIKFRIFRIFFKWWYKKHPPEAVKYYKRKESVKAKVVHGEDGDIQMKLQGEKYNFPGMPRGYVIMQQLEDVKESFKSRVFNYVFDELGKIEFDMLPEDQLCPFVKELWRVLGLMEEAETTIDMKLRIKNMKKMLCFFFQEDDSYRFRAQWLIEKLDMNKCRLSPADRYYFRAKYFKADYDDPADPKNRAKNDILF